MAIYSISMFCQHFFINILYKWDIFHWGYCIELTRNFIWYDECFSNPYFSEKPRSFVKDFCFNRLVFFRYWSFIFENYFDLTTVFTDIMHKLLTRLRSFQFALFQTCILSSPPFPSTSIPTRKLPMSNEQCVIRSWREK